VRYTIDRRREREFIRCYRPSGLLRAWLSGNGDAKLLNGTSSQVSRHYRDRLALSWYSTSHPGQLSLAVPLRWSQWVLAMQLISSLRYLFTLLVTVSVAVIKAYVVSCRRHTQNCSHFALLV